MCGAPCRPAISRITAPAVRVRKRPTTSLSGITANGTGDRTAYSPRQLLWPEPSHCPVANVENHDLFPPLQHVVDRTIYMRFVAVKQVSVPPTLGCHRTAIGPLLQTEDRVFKPVVPSNGYFAVLRANPL